ncbi:paraneoplastic antigen Ma2-like [Antedon mediterranea]|uniref:paraneoplastic antigen Ma2-like n=1 Tax=Antedon mediterranea TaxID=105859 RepID=UPI003AF4EC44
MPDYVSYGIEWCEEKNYPVDRCLLLVSRKLEIPTKRIYISLCGSLPTETVDRREEVDAHGWQKTLVLAKLSIHVRELNIPETIVVAEDMEMRTIILKKTAVISTPMVSSSPAPTASTNNTSPAIDLSRLSLGSNYLKLRVFSGHTTDKSKDEDKYHVWRAQAKALIEEAETEVSQSEKKRRLREALRSPALDIIDDVKKDNPQATAKDYLDALEVVFGTTLSGEELYHQFVGLDQQAGEKPSDYLSRLQSSLRQIVQKGGIAADKANQALLKQFLKGTLFDQLLLVDLHLRDQVVNAPTYLTLLGQVRRWEEECQRKTKKAKAIGARIAHVSRKAALVTHH